MHIRGMLKSMIFRKNVAEIASLILFLSFVGQNFVKVTDLNISHRLFLVLVQFKDKLFLDVYRNNISKSKIQI